MITYQDCSGCGARKIHSTVRLCEVCETWERAEQEIAKRTEERDEARAERDALIGAGCSPEQNALALLDLYAERTRLAEDMRDKALSEIDWCVNYWKGVAREHDEAKAEAVEAFHDATELRIEIQKARVKAEIERDEALSKYHFMVQRAADEKLDGYRELGARAAAAENERDSLLNMVDSLTRALRGLLLSRDASWVGGHDWMEAVDDACKALGIEPGEDAE